MADNADDGYSDEDLDGLEDEDFLKLQEQAINAAHHPHTQPVPPRGQPITADELGFIQRSEELNGARAATLKSQDRSVAAAATSKGRDIPPTVKTVDQVTSRERFSQQSFGPRSAANGEQRNRSAGIERTAAPLSLPHRVGASQQERSAERDSNVDVIAAAAKQSTQNDAYNGTDLQARVQALLQEKERWNIEKTNLHQAVEEAKKDALGKSGEIAVLRAKHTKQLQDQDKLYQSLHHQHKAQGESHKRELDDARKEKERLVTHNRFLDHEVNDQAWQSRTSRTAGKPKDATDPASTPRRQRHQVFADGFDDSELEARSPVKIPSKSRHPTPKAGAKRKRDALNNSPAISPSKSLMGLDFSAAESPGRVATNRTLPNSTTRIDDGRSEFIHGVLNHRFQPGKPRLLEQLASLKLPSTSKASLYEMFLDKVPPRTAIADTEDVPAAIGLVALEIWSRCLQERFYQPIQILIQLTSYILFNGSKATAIRLMDEVVDLSQRTADINVIPRFKKLNKNAKVISVHLHDQEIEFSEYVDVHECLELLYLLASICVHDQEAMARFWHCIRFDFVSMLLRVVQPVPDVISVLRLLRTCIRHDLLATIKSQNTEGAFAEQHVLDRITSMLIEIPRTAEGEHPYTAEALLKLRLEILSLVENICEQRGAGHALAVHPQGIARLVRIAADELNMIYATEFHREPRSQIVSRAVRILFFLTSTYAQEIDLKEKLQQQPGGVNKFLITLARLAFSDAIYYEREISEDTFECAHQMLEEFATPEEAESLKAAFVKDDEG